MIARTTCSGSGCRIGCPAPDDLNEQTHATYTAGFPANCLRWASRFFNSFAEAKRHVTLPNSSSPSNCAAHPRYDRSRCSLGILTRNSSSWRILGGKPKSRKRVIPAGFKGTLTEPSFLSILRNGERWSRNDSANCGGKFSSAFDPDQPFFMYWAPGGVHGPHHVFPEWAAKYDGKFDDGWDAYRERTFQRQLEMGVIPEGTELTERDETLAAWDSIPESQFEFQTRLMELFAGFVEHTDTQVGRLSDGMADRGLRENTLVFYIFGDNGSSAEGQQGSISELLAQNNIPNTVEDQMAALDRIGGLDVLGSSKTDSMYHAGWAWAGSTPFKGTKLLGSYFGGTRNPMVVSWPGHIQADDTMRGQFHHVIDIAPTIYEVLEIDLPEVVNGYDQIPLDGTSLAYTFADAEAAGQKDEQFFDNNGSRGLYQDGWFAGTFGPFTPWDSAGSAVGIGDWDSAKDVWELYDLTKDFSQANDLAQDNPDKLAAMQARFLEVAEDNKDFPIGAGNWLRIYPADRVKTEYDSWAFTQNTERMPEFTAPGIGRQSTLVELDIEVDDNANGVLYAVGSAGGGLSVYLDKGHLVYEYNMLLIENYTVRAQTPLPAGQYRVTVDTKIGKPGGPADVLISVNDEQVAQTTVKRTVPAAFTATESFDVGKDLGSPVSTSYAEKRPFNFEGTISAMTVRNQ